MLYQNRFTKMTSLKEINWGKKRLMIIGTTRPTRDHVIHGKKVIGWALIRSKIFSSWCWLSNFTCGRTQKEWKWECEDVKWPNLSIGIHRLYNVRETYETEWLQRCFWHKKKLGHDLLSLKKKYRWRCSVSHLCSECKEVVPERYNDRSYEW